ncbi:YybH family protein [Emcibacter nanhaiensis]|uniref:Nuclear transport factor 2 family protein n=1 Tax=Emcibacter nanhaiensis TaxID=1505037 RepID=A0A501PFW7_9PROT|nr:nuclear transport factor 2 family protein [Emcibacter nanhaiensis]TPD58881.1 nuclear transport factor 2 family protein [Emcibacter nanhaiensis]
MIIILGTGARASEEEVANVERAFAQSMADRDIAAFASFVDDEAVFWGNGAAARGKENVLKDWAPYFEGEAAPFSWEPKTVLMLESGTLALSTGPVRTPDGRHVANYSSIWRKHADGQWKIVFDKGYPECPKSEAQ